MIIFPFNPMPRKWQLKTDSPKSSSDWVFQEGIATWIWTDGRGWLGYETQAQLAAEGLTLLSLTCPPSFPPPWGWEGRHAQLPAGLQVLLSPSRIPVRTVGEQVVLLERAERVCTPEAGLPWQRGVPKAVLGSRRDGRLQLVLVPGGFTATCRTGHNEPWVACTFTLRYFAWLAMSQHSFTTAEHLAPAPEFFKKSISK